MTRDSRSTALQLHGEEDLLAMVRSKAHRDRQRLLALPAETLAEAVSALSPRGRAEFLELSERGPELVPLPVHGPGRKTRATIEASTGFGDAEQLDSLAISKHPDPVVG